MITIMDKNPIRKAFSNAAVQYDLLTGLHQEIGRELIKKVRNKENCTSILDIGMGTGWLTGKLAFYFPEARVVGIDFAPGMVDHAKKHQEGFKIIQADACSLPFKENSFDLIVSNLSYQWIDDLPRAFEHCYRSLKKGGIFSFTMFGYETLNELFVSLAKAAGERRNNPVLPFRRLARQTDVAAAMRRTGFKNIEADYEKIITHFPDMLALAKWVKEIGANAIRKDIYIGKELLNCANDHYKRDFKDKFGVSATFEVLWITGKK